MERILGAIRVFVWLVFAVCGLVAVETRGDYCQDELLFCQSGGYPCFYQWVCYPEYETHIYSQPNWCLYEEGDQVFIKFNSQYQAVRWYVYHAEEQNPDPPSSEYSSESFFVQINPNGNPRCILVSLW